VAFQVSVCALPLSNNLKINLSPFVGEPIGALIVNAEANAVNEYWSYDAKSGVTDAAVV
jgi:hypothetical protein